MSCVFLKEHSCILYIPFVSFVIAADEETVLALFCYASENVTEKRFTADIEEIGSKLAGLRKEILNHYKGRKIKFI